MASAGHQVSPIRSRLTDVLEILKQGQQTCLHFTRHGDFSTKDTDESLIVLADEEYLCPYYPWWTPRSGQ